MGSYDRFRPDDEHLGIEDVEVITNTILEFEEEEVEGTFDLWRFWKTAGTYFAKRHSWQVDQMLKGSTSNVLAKRIATHYRKTK